MVSLEEKKEMRKVKRRQENYRDRREGDKRIIDNRESAVREKEN